MVLGACALPASAQTPVSELATPEALVCAPRLAPDESTPAGVVVGAPDVPLRQLFGAGDAVLLNVGRAEGLWVGTQFFMRRTGAPLGADVPTGAIRIALTSGWLRAVEVDEHSALAVIEQTCVEVRRGDRLAPFQWPAPVPVGPAGTVSYDDPATVLGGLEGRSMFGPGQFLVIDQGANRLIVPGQRVTFFRAGPRAPQDPVAELGEGVAVLVDATSATIQLINTRERIRSGDLVAVHR